jgi:hypothetical protein
MLVGAACQYASQVPPRAWGKPGLCPNTLTGDLFNGYLRNTHQVT